MISANSTIVNDDIPRPESDSVPLRQLGYNPQHQGCGQHAFFTSNLFLPSLVLSDGPDLNAFAKVFGLEEVAISASGISMSAMVDKRVSEVH